MASGEKPDPSLNEAITALAAALAHARVAQANANDPPPPAANIAPPSPPPLPEAPAEVDAEELKRLILVHNEKTKLTATATNTTAVALFGGGFVLPIVGLSFPLAAAPPPGQVTLITMIVWASVAGGLHWWARTMLERLR